MSTADEPKTASIEVRPPRRFTWPALFVLTAYGVLLLLPAVLSMLVVSTQPFSLWTYALPLFALAFATFLLPFGFGNTYAARIARDLKPALPPNAHPFLVQVTFSPRLRSGLRSLFEDADDIGWVYCGESALNICGDSVSACIPFERIRAVCRENAGLRGLFLFSRVRIECPGVRGAEQLWLAERSSLVLPSSRSTTRKLLEALSQGLSSSTTLSSPAH